MQFHTILKTPNTVNNTSLIHTTRKQKIRHATYLYVWFQLEFKNSIQYIPGKSTSRQQLVYTSWPTKHWLHLISAKNITMSINGPICIIYSVCKSTCVHGLTIYVLHWMQNINLVCHACIWNSVSGLLFFRPLAQSRRLNIVLSKVWLQRRLIGVKSFKEGDRISPLEDYWQLLKQKGGFSGFTSD